MDKNKRYLGIFISGDNIYLSGLVNEGDAVLTYYLRSEKADNEEEVISLLNKIYQEDKEFFENAVVNINIPNPDLLRIVPFEDGILDDEKIVEWEIENFLPNKEDFYYNFVKYKDSLLLGAIKKKKAKDFIQKIDFKVDGIDMGILGLFNAFQFSYLELNNVVLGFFDSSFCYYLFIGENDFIDYKIEPYTQDYINNFSLFISLVKDKISQLNNIIVAGENNLVEDLINSNSDYEKFNFGNITMEILDDNDPIRYVISLGFALKYIEL